MRTSLLRAWCRTNAPRLSGGTGPSRRPPLLEHALHFLVGPNDDPGPSRSEIRRASFDTRLLAGVAACLLLLGCNDEPADADAGASDAGVRVDAGTSDASVPADAGTDAGVPLDASSDAAVDAAIDAGSDGGSAEADVEVTLTYDGHSEPLDHAVFGYDREGDEIVGLYFELYRGGATGCPSESSPTPNQTLTLTGFQGAEPGTQTYADGVRVIFFDFEGLFYDDIVPVRASDASVEMTAHDREAGTAEIVLDATLQTETDDGVVEGSVTGRFVALHCESLDSDA